jgi:putative ATP-dependent endonuclease of the OLD family
VIRKVAIRNYRIFRKCDIDFSTGTNIVVGKNDCGKSTLIEAIALALTGRLNGRPIAAELSPYLINRGATLAYIEALADKTGPPPTPPGFSIDVFLEASDETEPLRGTNNELGEDACGVRLQVSYSSDFEVEYRSFVDAGEIKLPPTEYYKVDLCGFHGSSISARSIPAVACVLDASVLQLNSGVDYYLQNILRDNLTVKERAQLSREYRTAREELGQKSGVKAISRKLREDGIVLSDSDVTLGMDISRRLTWESSLAPHVGDIPFTLLGKGEQHALKTLLALSRRSEDAHAILIEEPETHLSFNNLGRLLERVESRCTGKQVIIATHSAYVLNKLGLDGLILLNAGAPPTRFTDLPLSTVKYFKKLAGFDTLRLALADRAILVEGPSDELIVQRAYRDKTGRLPQQDGIDVISVGRAHKRFLDIAVRLNRKVAVVTDNDGKSLDEVRIRFADYLGHECVTLHSGDDPKVPTLEPQIVAVNELETLNAALGRTFESKDAASKAMSDDKTTSALAIFESPSKIVMPRYILDAINA